MRWYYSMICPSIKYFYCAKELGMTEFRTRIQFSFWLCLFVWEVSLVLEP